MVKDIDNLQARLDHALAHIKDLEESHLKMIEQIRFYKAQLNQPSYQSDQSKVRDGSRRPRQMEKLAAVGRLVGGIANRMNDVLGAIMGSASVLATEVAEDETLSDDVENILNACRKGRDLTRDLLGFTRKGKYLKKNVSLNNIVTRVQQSLIPITSTDVSIQTQLEDKLYTIECDEQQIEHALVNICINALESLERDGSITITTSNHCVSVDSSQSTLQPGQYAEITVQDTGIGMSHDVLNKVFEPFFTTKSERKNSGLGLSIAHGAVENHSGAIFIESEADTGTTVSMLLPAKKILPATVPAKPLAASPAVTHKEGTILVVDDEQAILNASSRLLTKLGYDVLTASGGEQAIELFKKNRTDIILIILDVLMPYMNGAETYSHLQQMDSTVKVLICSGLAHDKNVEELLEMGASGFIQKPFDMAKLQTTILETINLDT